MKTLLAWLRSFRFAYEGMKYALTTQRNMKFHFFAALVVLLTALFVGLNKTDILLLLLAVTLVITMELVNTAVEKAVDLAMPERHPVAKIAKDTAAAAVMVCSIFAVIVGLVVFYDPVSRLLNHTYVTKRLTAGSVFIYLSLVSLSVVVLQTRFTANRVLRPSLWTALSFSVSTLIVLMAKDALVSLLGFVLSGLFLLLLFERGGRQPGSLLFGAVLGATVTILAYYLNQF